jgi:sodium transport system permease protein
MNISNPLIICQKEVSEIFRDKRLLLQVFGLPLACCPVIAYFWFVLGKQATPDVWIIWCQFFAVFPLFLNVPTGVSLTTGEKERGTIETTLTLCASRKELIFGKYLAIMLTSLASAAAMFLSVVVACFVASYLFHDQVASPTGRLFQKLAICYGVYSGIYITWFSSMMLVIGLFARNTREATGLSNALLMVSVALPAIGTILELKTTCFTILLPIANCNLVCRQFLNSSVEWYFWLILVCTTIVYTWIPLQYAIRLIKSDAMLTPP